MNRLVIAAAWVAFGATALAAETPPTSGSGWTGVTNPKDVITARAELMEHIEILMEPIDTILVKPIGDREQLRSNAAAIGAMLAAAPHLFPPTTNLYDPKASEPATLALPAIWKSFDSFYKLAATASSAAEAMAEIQSDGKLRAASRKLRASCDACHALYLRKYEPPKVLDSDLNFDFESAIGTKKK